jgi:cytochrome b involved in lipid metabolism
MSEKTYKMEEVAQHKSAESLWFVIEGMVYDVTAFLEDHPGGDDVLKDKGGEDATQAFDDIGHSPEAVAQLAKYKIGRLDGKERRRRRRRRRSSSVVIRRRRVVLVFDLSGRSS